LFSFCEQVHGVSFASYIQSAGNYFICTKHGSFKPHALPLPGKIAIGLFDNQPGCWTSPMTFGSVIGDRYIRETVEVMVIEKIVTEWY
jgi:hypothetical protein